ncbi:FMN-binding protein, partial [Hungatella effluvii]
TVPTSGEVATYVPGVYSSAITLNNQDVNVQVTVDADKITSVTLVPLSEAVTTMYPLMQPAMDTLSEQIVKNQSTKNISYSDETRYTSTVLLKAVDTALTKAEIAK